MFLQKSLRAQILALLSGSLLAMLLIALASFHFLSTGVQNYRNLIDGPLRASQLIDEANLQFKVQVQEWKNVLLRGKQPADLAKYWKQFEDRQHDVQGILGQLIALEGVATPIKTRIEGLRDEHRQLGAAYQKGRDAFVTAGGDAAAGDAAVKGVDRAASEQMSALVVELRKLASEQSAQISAGADRTIMLGTVIMLVSGKWRRVLELFRLMAARPKLIAGLLVSSALLGVQLWLFMWAPLNDYSLDVSLGYFLLPLAMVLTGRIAYGESLSYLQKIAVFFASLGVLNELYQVGGFSWATLVVVVGYPLYFVLRKYLKTDNLGGLWVDMTLMLPVAYWFVQGGEQGLAVFDQYPGLMWLIPLLGLISASALVVYIIASRLLPFSLFGLLSYVEPVLLLAVALLLGESIKSGEWLTYIPIWLAVVVLVFEGFKHLTRQRRS